MSFDDFIPSPLPQLYDSMELGNTRCVALLSCQYAEEIPPISNAGKGESSKRWVDVAAKSGNLRTILFVFVWEQVAAGNFPPESLIELRKYVMSAKKLNLTDMLMSIRGTFSASYCIH